MSDQSTLWVEITPNNYRYIRMNADCIGENDSGEMVSGDWVGYYDENYILYTGIGGFKFFEQAWVNKEHVKSDHIAEPSKTMPSNISPLLESDIFPEFGKKMILERYPDYRDIARFTVCADLFNGQKQLIKDFDIDFANKHEKPWLQILRWPEWAQYAAMDIAGKVHFCFTKPTISEGGNWKFNYNAPCQTIERGYESCFYIIHGDLDWRKSLTMRPEGK